LWTFINNSIDTFINIFYIPDPTVLIPSSSICDLQLWKTLYLRWYHPPRADILTQELRTEMLKVALDNANQRIKQLETELELQKKKQ